MHSMPIEKAKKHYLGKDNHQKLNCAKSILEAFEELDEKTSKEIGHGGGSAPSGECGAAYAAKYILNKHNPDKLTDFEERFKQLAGSTKCKEIRKLRKLSCVGCVEKSAELLSELKG